MFQPKVFVPSDYINQVLEMSKGVFDQNEEINFLKSCLYYLTEGMDAKQAIDLAMIDYLVDL